MCPVVKFRLKNPKSDSSSPIYLIFYQENQRFHFGTGEKIHPDLWNVNTERPIQAPKAIDPKLRNQYNYLLKKVSGDITLLRNTTRRLNKYVSEVGEYFALCEEQNNDVDLSELRNRLSLKKKIVKPSPKRQPKEENKENPFLVSVIIAKYVKAITNGKKKTKKGNRFAYSTIKTNTNLRTIWSDFEKVQISNFEITDINKELYDLFLNHMNSKKYSLNTTGKHLTNFKIMMREQLADIEDENYKRVKEVLPLALPENEISRIERILKRYFKVSNVETTEIALTEKELALLYNLDLSDNPNQDLVRDIFLCGCYIGNRVSDYKRIGPEHYKRTVNGPRIVLRQTKTGHTVTLPVKPELEAILKKYKYQLPKTSDQNINRTIKDIAEIAKINDKVEVVRSEGDKVIITKVPKYKLIKTHTARRTLCTILTSQGMPYNVVMVLSGHKSVKSFERYIRLNKEDTVKRLAEAPFFTNKKIG